MESLYEFLCYYSREYLDPIMDEMFTFIHFALSSLHSFPATSTVLSEATDSNFNEF